MYESLLRNTFRPACDRCGQIIRSEERLRNHHRRCLGDGRWVKKFNADMRKCSKPQIIEEAENGN
jgi:hypothetical protein